MAAPPNTTPPQPPSQPASKTRVAAQWARYAHLGLIVPSAVFVGWLFGAALDRWLGTTWIQVAGIVLGAVAGFFEIFRAAIKISRE